MQALKSELEPEKSRLIWTTIWQETPYLKPFSLEEIITLSENTKPLKMFRGDTLIKVGERITWIGFILLGEVGVYQNTTKLSSLTVGDPIGYTSLIPGICHHNFDLTVLQSGYISILFLTDLPTLANSFPKTAFKLNYSLSLKTLNTLSIQYTNSPFLNPSKIVWTDYPLKKVQEYLDKWTEATKIAEEFLEKAERRTLVNVCKVMHLEVAKPVVRRGDYENCVFVLLRGEMLEVGVEQRYLRQEEVIGLEQFFFGNPWPADVTTSSACDVLVIHREVFNQVALKSPGAAIKVYKLLHRIYLNRLASVTRFKYQSYFVDIDMEKLEKPPGKLNIQKDMTLLDYIYTVNNVLPKQEVQGFLFPEFRAQKQVDYLNSLPKKPKEKEVNKGKKVPVEVPKAFLWALEKTETAYVNFAEELEDLNYYKEEVMKDKAELEEKLEKVRARNQELRRILHEKREEKKVLGVRMMHNQVIRSIGNAEQVKASMRSPFLDIVSRSFFDITSAQIKEHKSNYLALKYAKKWKEYVIRRKQFRIIQERKRFWPGE